jgi:hypothetical protein
MLDPFQVSTWHTRSRRSQNRKSPSYPLRVSQEQQPRTTRLPARVARHPAPSYMATLGPHGGMEATHPATPHDEIGLARSGHKIPSVDRGRRKFEWDMNLISEVRAEALLGRSEQQFRDHETSNLSHEAGPADDRVAAGSPRARAQTADCEASATSRRAYANPPQPSSMVLSI